MNIHLMFWLIEKSCIILLLKCQLQRGMEWFMSAICNIYVYVYLSIASTVSKCMHQLIVKSDDKEWHWLPGWRGHPLLSGMKTPVTHTWTTNFSVTISTISAFINRPSTRFVQTWLSFLAEESSIFYDS